MTFAQRTEGCKPVIMNDLLLCRKSICCDMILMYRSGCDVAAECGTNSPRVGSIRIVAKMDFSVSRFCVSQMICTVVMCSGGSGEETVVCLLGTTFARGIVRIRDSTSNRGTGGVCSLRGKIASSARAVCL